MKNQFSDLQDGFASDRSPLICSGGMIIVKHRFVGFHRWLDAPEEVAFLRDYHRHVFHARIGLQIGGMNRELEFFTEQKFLVAFCRMNYENMRFDESCEQMAFVIARHFHNLGRNPAICAVSEDGENEGVLTFPPFNASPPAQ